MGFNAPRLGLGGSFEARQRVFEPVDGAKRLALIDMKLRSRRLNRERAVIASDRRVDAAKPHMEAAAFVER